jgi:two-component system sensor histidine kinase EvgS
MPGFIVSDEHRIRQTLYNLLGTALKFTEEGSITLKAFTLPNEELCDLVIEVIDTGRGIPDHELQKVFEKYSQVDQKSDTELGGTGLGLSISTKLINLLNGEIGVESKWGQGSKFSITLKDLEICYSSHAMQNESKDYFFDSEDVLIVDDNPANRRLVAHYLTGSGLSFRTAENGQVALSEIQEHIPDLILMDLQMDVMNGVEATKAIRANNELKDIPVIVITANQLHNVDEKLFDSCLLKPVERYQLLDEIAKVLKAPSKHIVKEQVLATAKTMKAILSEDQNLRQSLQENVKTIQESETVCDLKNLCLTLEKLAHSNDAFEDQLQSFRNALDSYDLRKTSKWLEKLTAELV